MGEAQDVFVKKKKDVYIAKVLGSKLHGFKCQLLILADCASSGKFLNPFVPQLPHLYTGD